MALATVTFADLKNAAQYAIGKSATLSSGALSSLGEIVNDALQWFAQGAGRGYPWFWRRKLVTLESTADQNYLALPADFDKLASIKAVSRLVVFRPATIDYINLLRQISTTAKFNSYFYSVGWTPQAAVTAAPIARMELFPTPGTTTTTGFANVHYLRALPTLSGGTDVPDIPVGLHSLLRTLCRAWAISSVEQQSGHDWEIFNNGVENAIASDGGVQPVAGRLLNQLDYATDSAGVDNLFPYSGITP